MLQDKFSEETGTVIKITDLSDSHDIRGPTYNLYALEDKLPRKLDEQFLNSLLFAKNRLTELTVIVPDSVSFKPGSVLYGMCIGVNGLCTLVKMKHSVITKCTTHKDHLLVETDAGSTYLATRALLS